MSWRDVKLSDVCELINGRAYAQPELLDSGKYRVLRVGNFFTNKNWYYSDLELDERKYCDFGDLLYAWSASFGPRFWQGEKSIFHYHIWKIEVNSKIIDKRFLYYFLDWDVENIKKESGAGATMIHVSKKSMDARLIRLPSLITQQKIVVKIDSILAEIDKAISAAESNAKNSYALYSSAVDSIFGKLTDKTVKLSSCSDIGYGYTSKSSSEFIGPQYLRITDIQDDNVDWLLVPKINENTFNVEKFLLKDGDIVFARTGATTGKSYLIKEPPVSVFASYLIRVDANRNFVEPEFLRHFFRSEDYWTAINAGISGAAQGGFNASKLGELSFPLPDLIIQRKIIEKLDVIENHSNIVKKAQENKVKELKLLRQAILKQAFNGELVKE